jgi:hypothetical protein
LSALNVVVHRTWTLFTIPDSLGSVVQNQSSMDNLYSELCGILTSEMDRLLEPTTVVLYSGTSNKRRRLRKAWWNEALSVMWNDVCAAQKQWIKAKGRSERQVKKSYVIATRNIFDKSVQRRKRQHWCELQN